MAKRQTQHTASHSLPYSPAMLLDARLSASITDDPEFRDHCRIGFGCVSGLIAEGEVYTVGELLDFVRVNVLGEDGFPRFFSHRIGFVLGGLSALALSQYREARAGLSELMRLLEREQMSSPWPGASRSVDSDSWPLDL